MTSLLAEFSKMSNFFQRFKKKRSNDTSKSPSWGVAEEGTNRDSTPEQQVLEQRDTSSEPEGPVQAVEMSDSIFAGLQLSAPVRKKEGSDSPYLKRISVSQMATEPDTSKDGSPFSFLQSSTVEPEEDESGLSPQESPFGFIQEAEESKTAASNEDNGAKSKEDSSSSFSFLNEPTVTNNSTALSHTPVDMATKETPFSMSQQNRENKQQGFLPSEPHSLLQKGYSVPSPIPPQSPTFLSPSSSQAPTLKQNVGRQQPPTGTKKKKKLAQRPGQAKVDSSFSGLLLETVSQKRDPDSLSVSSQASSLDGGKDSVSMSSSSSEVHKLTVEEAHKVETGIQDRSGPEALRDGEGERKQSAIDSTDSVDKPSDLDGSGSRTELVSVSDSPPKRTSKGNDSKGDNEDGVRTQPEVKPSETAVESDSKPSDTQLLTEVFRKEQESPNYDVELTPGDKMTALLQSYDSNLGNIMSSLSGVHKTQKEKVEEHLAKAKQQIERRMHVNKLREKEGKALSEEDYDLAEELSQELEAVSLEPEWTIADNCLVTLREWAQSCAELMENEVTIQQDIRRQLVEIREEETKGLAEMDKDLSSAQTKQKMRLKTLEDEIERERGHIALDREHLEKREQLLQGEIKQRAADFIAKKEELQETLTSIESEIATLETKLAELREQRSGILSSIGDEEERIRSIHEELSLENGQLAEERRQIESKEEKLQGKVDYLSEQQRASEETLGQQEAQRLVVVRRVEEVERRETAMETRAVTLQQVLRQLEDLVPPAEEGGTMLRPSDQLQSLQDTHRSKDSHVRELTSQVLSLQSELVSLRKKMADIEAQTPQMQEAKKAAVAARQYKEAARLASEIKALNSTLESEQENKRRTETALAEKNEELATASRELSTIKEELNTMEKEEDVAHVKLLVNSVASLQSKMASIPGTDSPFLEVLQHWCNLYQLLAENLCTKHNLNLADFAPDEPAPSQTAEKNGTEPNTSPPDSGLSEQHDTTPPPEERTPGVGMELDSPPTAPLPSEVGEEERKKIAQLEAQIEEACRKEDYDLAAELDEQLKELKNKVHSAPTN